MTLGEIKSQFLGLMNRNELRINPSLASTFINQSFIRMQRELRVPFMEKYIDYTVSSTQPWLLQIPNDMLELISIMVDSDGDGLEDYQLQRVELGKTMRRAQTIDIPRMFARRADHWVLGPQPAAGTHVYYTYYSEFAIPATDDDETNVTLLAWDAVVYGALSAACDFYNDDRTQRFETRYTQIMQNLQSQADADELTADASVQPALVYDDSEEWIS